MMLRALAAHIVPAAAEEAQGVAMGTEEEWVDIPRLQGTATPTEIARTLTEQGVVIIENVVDPAVVEAVTSQLADKEVFYGEEGSFARHDTTRNAAKALGESVAAQELAMNPTVLAAVEEQLLPWTKKVVLGTCSAITVEPPAPGQVPADHQVLHRDDGMWAVSQWPMQEPRPDLSVSCMWALTDFTEGNGATRFVPKSHKMDRSAPVNAELAVRAQMKAGSVALWLGATLHGASSSLGTEETEDPRKGLLFIYNQGWLKSEHNFHFAIPPEVQKGFHPTLRDLVGHTGENAMEHEWYTGPVYTQPYLGPAGKHNGNLASKKNYKQGTGDTTAVAGGGNYED